MPANESMNEKRRYFRIEDRIGLALRFLKDEKPVLQLSTAETVIDQELKNVEAELNSLVNAIWGVDPKVAKSIGLLNRKIEILCDKQKPVESRKDNNFDIRYHNLPVSLSASGLAFISDNALPENERIEMMLLLSPARTRVVVRGSVVEAASIQVDDSQQYQIRIDFSLNATEEELLIQHIVQRQVQLISKNEKH